MAVGVGSRVTKIGFPEVDEVIQASVFTTTRASSPKVKVQPQESRIYIRSGVKSTDHISRLPDEVLEFIVSRLTMREGAATSALSRRWRNLWSRSVSCYNFDPTNLAGYSYLADPLGTPGLVPHLRDDKTFLSDKRQRFTQWVRRVLLEPRRESKMHALRVSFLLGIESASHINRWLTHAADRGLGHLELDFELRYIGRSMRDVYEFPFQSFGSLRYLHLNGIKFSYPPNFKGLNSLVSMALKCCFLSKEGLQNMLLNCSSLKCLTLEYCRFDGFLLNISGSAGSLLTLKHLVLYMAVPDQITHIEVHDMSIISIEFHGMCTNLSIKNTPHLARLVVCTNRPLDIQSNIPRLETLLINQFSKPMETIFPRVNAFRNLKLLVFSANILALFYLLRACPLLQKLELDMGVQRPELAGNLENILTRHGTPHNNLKKVEIYGFDDDPEKIKAIVYLLRNANVLQKMKLLFSTTKEYAGNGEWILRKTTTVKQSETSMKKVCKYLQKETRPSTKLVLCPNDKELQWTIRQRQAALGLPSTHIPMEHLVRKKPANMQG